MAIPIKRFNWVSFRSTWEQNKIWAAKRKAMREDFEQLNAIAANTFVSAQSSLYTGLAELAAQASIKNSQAALAAKRAQVDKLV
jgi:hypothetical protein